MLIYGGSMAAKPEHETSIRKGEELKRNREETGPAQSVAKRAKRETKSARSYTGINPKDRDPIDPDMPYLQPA